jgi:hypothetical protein
MSLKRIPSVGNSPCPPDRLSYPTIPIQSSLSISFLAHKDLLALSILILDPSFTSSPIH